MFLVGSASAVIYSPMPINGKVAGVNVGDLTIEVTNMRTGKLATTETTSAGEYLLDWANTDDEGETIIKYMIGDTFKIVIPSCSDSPDCVKTVMYGGEPEIYVYFDLTSVVLPCPVPEPCPMCPEPVTCPPEKTLDDFKEYLCDEVDDFCFEEVENYCHLADVTPYTKEDCDTMNTPEDKTWQDVGGGVLVGLMLGFILFVGGGMKFYKNRAGGATLQHRHKGIRGYHDPNIAHMNIAYRHTRWKDNPLKCLRDVKTIEDKGGLV